MSDEFRGKIALITGAGKRNGIGFGLARKLAGRGANLVMTDLAGPPVENSPITYGSLDEMSTLAEEIRAEFGVEVLTLEMDVSRTESVEAALATVREKFGGLDVLINNAGTVFGAPQTAHEYEETAWIRTIDVNLHGVYRVTKAAVPLMKGRAGAIVNMASKAGKSPAVFNGAYSVSKAGVIMLTKVMARELASEGIRVNAVCPGLIRTDLQKGNIALKAFVMGTDEVEAEKRMAGDVPLGRLGSIEETADLCVFLASERASYITGQAVNIDGGMLMEC